MRAYIIYSNCVMVLNITCLFTWQQHCALSFGRSQSQLVKGHHLTACLQDPAAGTIGYPQSADLWEHKQDMRTMSETVTNNITMLREYTQWAESHLYGKKKCNYISIYLSIYLKKKKRLPWAWGYPESWHHQWRIPQQLRFCSHGQASSSYGSGCNGSKVRNWAHTSELPTELMQL